MPCAVLIRSTGLVITAMLVLAGCVHDKAPRLPALALDPERVAVAGFSSGAAMAQQAHLAYSDGLLGAVLLAGPPYQCAEGSLDLALSRCIKGTPTAPDVARLAGRVRERAARGALAPLAGLAGDKVLVLHGRRDALVVESVARAAWSLYDTLGGDMMKLRWDGDGEYAHLWPTLGTGVDCTTMATPYLGNCGLDLAAVAMQWLYGDAPRPVAAAQGELLPFDQTLLNPEGNDAFLDQTGYLYVPAQCRVEHRCGLLVAFHGCEQNAAAVGEAFVRDAGFNRWADVHDVVVLYPQARASYLPLNPKACWDWWGYSGADYDTRSGVQLRWLANAAAALGVALK